MTKFHVDLGDPPLEEMPPPPPGKLGWTRSFKEFKSLKKAVRWAREQHDAGFMDEWPQIVDDNGDPIEIDWDSPMWLTHHELEQRLNTAETSRTAHRLAAEKLHAEQAARDVEMIKAGYIPVRILAPHITEISAHRHGPDSHSMFGRDFAVVPPNHETEYTIKLRSFYRFSLQPDPFTAAIGALTDRNRP